ncbi:class I SAM-dependent methyltransferase [Alisedimentitalea sp. MJ-SS2]|uniref:class I SAM-dependent methyltransferase n=1 Tax=Aliisedimentitalea sp. MJ-SS2 TaxID=3049795 RepID=UPI002915B8F6|nr:class I SAM-dependent methyltransferase [Alisedimentitalea sp. MJ-SS2]MDU8929556.1 class I SAM-dependent methyltransferase [Alisedimentitalea sp. MJ-SS2]
MTLRLTHLLESGGGVLPESGEIVVFGPVTVTDLAPLPRERLRLICREKPQFDRLKAAGFDVLETPPDHAALSIVFLPRAKKQARAVIARAMEKSDAVIIDGQKTDGIDSVLREMRKRTTCSQPYSKAHGKIFTAQPANGVFEDWTEGGAPKQIVDGFTTVAGVFSADGIDPASRLLAAALPDRLKGRVADFGAGWGYLSAEILKHPGIDTLDLVEADNAALDCARINITDPRAHFHWADATSWKSEKPLDAVIMNPPFHEGRKGVPELGRDFIRNAARNLSPSGRLYMVANRHLPYEAALRESFREVEELPSDNRFKLFAASRPSRVAQPRPNR